MILAIDVGNTNVVLGVFHEARLVENWRLQTVRERTADELGLLVSGLFAQAGLARSVVDEVVISSVVPPLTGAVCAMAERQFGAVPLVVDPAVNSGMPILYHTPADVGADRIVNAVAAYERFGKDRRPIIVCDFGTATTLDVISKGGEYLGGVICPGVGISADALFQRAARLPRVGVRKPDSVIGHTTVGAIESGLFWGYVGMVEGLITRITRELGGVVTCVATGGLATLIAPETPLIQHVDVNLTLEGLRLVWARNRTAAR
jgi:type III pantothenate kinase